MKHTPFIEVCSKDEFRVVSGAHTMRLKRSEHQAPISGEIITLWTMYTANPCTRAYNRGMESSRRFHSLAEVESAYKSWRGIVALESVLP